MKLISLKSSMLLVIVINCLITIAHSQFEEIATAKEIYDGAKVGAGLAKKVYKFVENGCIINENCFKNIFAINNLCCTIQCCNAVTYIFKDEHWRENINDVISNPHPMNILFFVLLLLSTLCTCFIIACCCCCCSRKPTTTIIMPSVRRNQELINLPHYKPLINSDVVRYETEK